MQASTLKEIARHLDALMPASVAGAVSYHGIKDFPGLLSGYLNALFSSADSYRFMTPSLKTAYESAASAISETPVAEFAASHQDALAIVWALGCYAYVYRSIRKIQEQQAALKPPPLPHIEPTLP
jgi:hypothetical protein